MQCAVKTQYSSNKISILVLLCWVFLFLTGIGIESSLMDKAFQHWTRFLALLYTKYSGARSRKIKASLRPRLGFIAKPKQTSIHWQSLLNFGFVESPFQVRIVSLYLGDHSWSVSTYLSSLYSLLPGTAGLI